MLIFPHIYIKYLTMKFINVYNVFFFSTLLGLVETSYGIYFLLKTWNRFGSCSGAKVNVQWVF
jgi:hypothetical protein